jgi:hypothetical protein
MKNKPYMPEPEMPGPGTYDVKTFVEMVKNDPRNFTLGKKEDYAFRKKILFKFYLTCYLYSNELSILTRSWIL